MIGPNEIMIIGVIIVLLFGASKLPELARSVGKSMGEFKKAQREAEKELSPPRVRPMTSCWTRFRKR